ncbi:cytochrome c maturation protein CcmE [Legionella sp.]|uniref:cytochrome c maturation protein CcmE n=1 Tax=Legionella sp. TaxID=459 RepID=UPI003C9A8B04
MNPVRKRKLLILLFTLTVLSLSAGLVLYALRQNISLFYTPTQIAEGKAPLLHVIRIGGMVEKGSFIRAEKSLKVEFKITDFSKAIVVIHTGILPDLFREEQGVVVEGQLIDRQHFQATRVLAKHDANYMPPEVKAALAKR